MNPPPFGDFLGQWFLDTLLYDYSISAFLHSKYWDIKQIMCDQTYAPPWILSGEFNLKQPLGMTSIFVFSFVVK